MSSKLLVPALALLVRPILALDEQYFLLASDMSPDSRLVFFESFYHFKCKVHFQWFLFSSYL